MYNTRIALAVLSSTAATFAVINYRRIRKQELEKRALYVEDAVRQIDAIYNARDKMIRQMENGLYSGNIKTIRDDLTFYTMAERFEN